MYCRFPRPSDLQDTELGPQGEWVEERTACCSILLVILWCSRCCDAHRDAKVRRFGQKACNDAGYSHGRGRAKEVIQLRRVGQLERVLWRLENCERAWSARANRCFASTQRAECRNGQSHYSHYSPCQLNRVGIEPSPEISICVSNVCDRQRPEPIAWRLI